MDCSSTRGRCLHDQDGDLSNEKLAVIGSDTKQKGNTATSRHLRLFCAFGLCRCATRCPSSVPLGRLLPAVPRHLETVFTGTPHQSSKRQDKITVDKLLESNLAVRALLFTLRLTEEAAGNRGQAQKCLQGCHRARGCNIRNALKIQPMSLPYATDSRQG